ncbi:PQQ-binding-like beta-propeller repeat protein [Streptomyces sp. SID14515]|uniref:outer membrane protein assembly factor BamB family protein n=1 Tax=Streptomyces sp. SID14515 TaxID=2706074 RepID=UPI0013C6086D|nr:PQQ-binding-like beta-propeller repeat protein [Streptomyces sp. SID14515]NEB40947.1 PQQ-binding-like beta-propeller repeat protein [Streptomyces sp. SID14515]NEB42071.1 PQQ-binding-like beta-propeller repeat protein [Streptomyces sp. SID14515]
MSQPPPQQGRPGEPEGFGAPYEPQPGAYGAPGQPPHQPQPGPYGQPQPGPYGQQPPTVPYGYPQPQQPTGPYGYPQPQPQPQPPTVPYGRPQQPSGGPGGGGRSRGRVAGLVAAVLAGVLVIGTGVWFAVGGDDGADDKKPVAKESTAPKDPSADPSPKPTPAPGAAEFNKKLKEGEAKVRWILKNDVDVPSGGVPVRGPWITDGIVAKAMYRTASGYSLDDGSQKWSLRLPADVCAAPSQPSPDGKIVIALRESTEEGADCEKLQMIDLVTGKAGWTATLDRSSMSDGLSDVVMAVNGDVVTAGRTTRTDAYRISDGKHLWDRLPGTCQPYGFASGDVPLAAVDCLKAPSDTYDEEVRRIDPATGKTVWTYKVKKGWRIDKFYSVDPPVVSLRQDEPKPNWAIALLSNDGTLLAQPDPGKEEFEMECGQRDENLDDCLGATAGGDTFYLATKPAYVNGAFNNSVVAFDMKTGKIKWKVPAPPGQTLKPMRVENGKVLLYLAAPESKATTGGGIMALGPQGGALQTVLRHPTSAAKTEHVFDPTIRYADGRSLIAIGRIGGESDEEEMDVRTIITFGD